MLKVETYKEKLRKLEEKYKDNKNSEYLKERVNLMVSDLTPHFPKDITIFINYTAINLTDDKKNYVYPKEVENCFDIRGDNVTIEDLQYLVKELNKLEKAAISLKIFKRSKHWTLRNPIQYFIDKAKSKCFEYIEKLNLPDNYNYEEMKDYCDYIVKVQGKYNANDYNCLDIFECRSNYTDQQILLCSPIVCDTEGKLLKLEQKRHITKLKKFGWKYYQYTFEYLRNYFSSYYKEYFNYYKEKYDRILEDFTKLSAFFITMGNCKVYDYNLGSVELSSNLYLDYDNDDYLNESEEPIVECINYARYFWHNLNYIYNSIYNNAIFTNIQKKYLYVYIQDMLDDILALMHCDRWI